MKKYLVIAVPFFSLAAVQASPTPEPKSYTPQDTTLALQQLFASKRSTGRIYTMVGSCYLAGGLFALPVGAVGLLQTGFGLLRQTRFRRAREIAILQAYEQGSGLPNRMQRRLKAKYFH